jgi:putative oxidoreductase
MSATSRRRDPSALLGVLFGTSATGWAMDVALLAIRAALSWTFIYYGASKLFGSFSGPGPKGIHQASLFFSNTAHLHPGGFFAVLGGTVEFLGGIAMALGLATRLAGLALFADMVIAMITVTWVTGFNSVTSPPGYQLNVAVGALALAVTLIGAGRFSVDAIIVRRFRLEPTDSPRDAPGRVPAPTVQPPHG